MVGDASKWWIAKFSVERLPTCNMGEDYLGYGLKGPKLILEDRQYTDSERRDEI